MNCELLPPGNDFATSGTKFLHRGVNENGRAVTAPTVEGSVKTMRLKMALMLLAALATYAGVSVATLDRSSDTKKLEAVVAQAAKSVSTRNLDGIISHVSENYKDSSGLNYQRLRMIIAQSLRSDSDYACDAAVRSLSITGDRADVGVRVKVRGADLGTVYERDITLHFIRERAMHNWIIPTTVWRVNDAEGHGLASFDTL